MMFLECSNIFWMSLGHGQRRAHMGRYFNPGAQSARKPPRVVTKFLPDFFSGGGGGGDVVREVNYHN